MPTVRWLHISDLHLNTPGFGSSFLRDELPKFLRRSGITCDYVFCTGDLRDARRGVFPDDNGQFLKDICDATGGRLFVVPGNHDVERGEIDGKRHQAVQKILSYYRSDEGIIKTEDLMILHDGQEKFRSYLSTMALTSYDPQQPHFNVETEHFNILHVDSTLTYTIGHEDNLILGTNALYDVIRTLNRTKPTILLTHYAFTMIAQEERKRISEMLYSNGIQLWLAGHEHEHNLQPVKYLHSIQSGELRLEDKCNTSVLVGEFDTDTCSGKIRAYAWFPEGWHLYPAIWHSSGREDEYPFVLRLQENGNLLSLEAINSHRNNEKFRRPFTTLLDNLLADVEYEGVVYHEFIECLQTAWESHEQLVLIADGGMGKTTRMFSLCDELRDKPAVYLPLESTEDIIRDLCRALFSESSEERLYQFSKDRHTDPDVYLFLDGMNEVGANRESDLVKVIKRIARDYPGIQIIVSSRSNFLERYPMGHFSLAHIQPLREEQIKTLFTETEWTEIESNPPLKNLVRNPLMATLYKNISPEMGNSGEYIDWIVNITNETELIYDYYMSQIAKRLHQDIQNINVVQFVKRCLPYIAFCFERSARHTMQREEYDQVLKDAVSLDADVSIDSIRRGLRIRDIPQFTDFDLGDFLFNVSHLMYDVEGVVSFPHQIHRDYLSALWMTETPDISACWNERFISTTLSNHIRVLSGDGYWNGKAREILDCARGHDGFRKLIINLINTFPYNERSGVPDFSHIDLQDIRIPDYDYAGERIKLEHAKIDRFSIGCEAGEVIVLNGMSFSPDEKTLAGIFDGEIYIYSMETGLKVYKGFVYQDGRRFVKGATRFSSDSRYLFVRKNPDLIVFRRDENQWSRIGAIEDVYQKKIYNTIIHDELLTFYYANRLKTYSLANVALVDNIEIQKAYENHVDGEDIAQITYADVDMEGKFTATSDSYRAICYPDGKLVVNYKGGKLFHLLEIGKGVLRTAAISKDGNRAVTLSSNIYKGRRRIQLWNLDTRNRDGEFFCEAQIDMLYLTDRGEWIIGFDGRNYRFWNWNDRDRTFTRPERLIAETNHGVTTSGNSVFFQDGDGKLQELNLDTGMTRQLGRYQPIQYATTLPNGNLAIVGHSEKTVDFNSNRDGRELRLNREQARIKYVHAFKSQPFIAVLTAGGLVSMYHIGTGQRTRKLQSTVGYRLVAFHPENNVFSFSDGDNRIETYRYFEWNKYGKKIGQWYGPERPKFAIDGKIIAIGFNTDTGEQIMIETNGKITYMQDKFCDLHSQTTVITNFSVENYDFSGVVCSDEIKEQLISNGATIETS